MFLTKDPVLTLKRHFRGGLITKFGFKTLIIRNKVGHVNRITIIQIYLYKETVHLLYVFIYCILILKIKAHLHDI